MGHAWPLLQRGVTASPQSVWEHELSGGAGDARRRDTGSGVVPRGDTRPADDDREGRHLAELLLAGLRLSGGRP